ncbi:MAG: B12-binding domain-containing radical SAM protein, partial [Deltaproteobacteria bacterium]|nr:B12-binding domain-containing radical SAM protein [Deltaproteobacteria bacterium]
ADIVLTGGMLPQQKGILTTIERAHAQGKRVAVGGPDPTSQPHVYEEADFLVLGEGELTIPPFIEDLGKGLTSGLYWSETRADMTRAAVPRFDLIRFTDYMRVG